VKFDEGLVRSGRSVGESEGKRENEKEEGR
jgi:hypothetical protein